MFSGLRSILNGLTSDPGGTILTLVYVAVCILFSLIIHECAHGYVALKCGDPTAKWLGRLTLDPRKHLDPLGTICMVFMRIGWAKPVPVNPRNFRHYRRDYILVSIAGIAEGRRHGSIVPGLHQQAGSAELFWKVQGVSVRERVMLHPPGAGETGQLFGRRVRLREGVVQAAEALAPAVLEAVGRGRAAASRQAQQQGHCAERHDDAFP